MNDQLSPAEKLVMRFESACWDVALTPRNSREEQAAEQMHRASRAALVAYVEELRADAERFAVLCDTSPGCLCFMGHDYQSPADFRQAIDAIRGRAIRAMGDEG